MNETEENSSLCMPYQFNEPDVMRTKFWLIYVVGSLVCFCGILASVFLLSVLLQRQLRRSYLFYLVALAILDIGILGTYILTFVVQVHFEYFTSFAAYSAWVHYMPILYFVQKVTLCAQTYLIVAVTFERYLEVRNTQQGKQTQISEARRWHVVIAVLVWAVIFRFSTILELEVLYIPECEGFESMHLTQALIVSQKWYRQYYMILADQIVRVFLPFVALMLLNLLIVCKIKQALRPPSTTEMLVKYSLMPADHILFSSDAFLLYDIPRRRQSIIGSTQQDLARDLEVRRRGLKAATNMMIAIVTSYLICNVFNMVITIWEFIDPDMPLEYHHFYTVAADMVSLLVIVNSSMRLPIYYACNPKVRQEIRGRLSGVKRLRRWFSSAIDRRKFSFFHRRRSPLTSFHDINVKSPDSDTALIKVNRRALIHEDTQTVQFV
uniref:G-protein coupled receptors family 1 profile domain-containing protein n=1 Tax=Plectus sambesii TaxID=2011161 RepID=A0A914X4E2_9BILA